MQYESELLKSTYLQAKCNDIKEVRKGLVGYCFEFSPYSKTIYIKFGIKVVNDYYYYNTVLRVSDHYPTKHTACRSSFIVRPNEIFTKKRKELFQRTLNNAVRECLRKSQDKMFERIKQKNIDSDKEL